MNMAQQAQRIQNVLDAFRLPCRVADPPASFEASAYRVYRLRHSLAMKTSRVTGLSSELGEALGVPVRFDNMPLSVEVQRDDPQVLPFGDLWEMLTRNAPKTGVPLVTGQGISGGKLRPMLVDLSSSTTPHILISGMTGSGKTVEVISLILSACIMRSPSELSLIILDPKKTLRHHLYGLPHLACPIMGDIPECIQGLGVIVAELERRMDKGVINPDSHVVVVVDELAEMIAESGEQANAYLRRITTLGREFGIHLIAATQKPTAEVIGTIVKSNLPFRIVGRVSNKTDANLAAGKNDTGAEQLPGRGAFVGVNGTVHRLQSYFVNDKTDECRRWVDAIAKRWNNACPHYRLDTDKYPAVGKSQTKEQAQSYQPPMVGSVTLTRKVYATFAEYYDADTGDLSYGGMAAMIRACFGDDSPTGGNYRQQSQKVVDYLKTTTTDRTGTK